MSTHARKNRKRSGIPFTRTPKTPTPLHETAYFAALVPGPAGTRYEGQYGPRSARKIARILLDRGFEIVDGDIVRREGW